MNLLLISNFIFSLQLSPFEKRALNVCTIYGRSEENFTPMLCGCAKQLRIRFKSKRLFKLCNVLKEGDD